jgi:hypothetical protein
MRLVDAQRRLAVVDRLAEFLCSRKGQSAEEVQAQK